MRIVENPAINMSPAGTGKSAEAVALAVLGALHQCVIENIAITAAKDALQPVAAGSGRIAYDCRFSRRFALPQPGRVAPVSITISQGVATLSCATSGAAIHYTLDGSYPAASAPSYGSPISLSNPCKVRAAAYLAGLSGSNVTAALSY